MTHPDTPTPAERPPDDRLVRRKAVLFCRDCEHESPVDGDWIYSRSTGGTTDVVCPDCGTVVTSRYGQASARRAEPAAATRGPVRILTGWHRLFDLQAAWLDAFLPTADLRAE